MAGAKRCFVIGPMNARHMPILAWLATEVLGPILEPKGFTVNTPDIAEIGNIMHHIIRDSDRAQLVVADTTGNNPNVLYEMAVLDAMGRPCIPVKVVGIEEEHKDLMPFDRAQYRFFTIDQNEPDKAREKMRKVIENVLKKYEAGDMFANPLTDYFGVPLSSFSSAYGLARGYYNNLLRPVVDGILNGKILDGPPGLAEAKRLHIDCVIPASLEDATRRAVGDLVEEGWIVPVLMEAPGRKIHLYAWSEAGPSATHAPALVDIPTTVYSLFQTVEARLGPNRNLDMDSPDYQELQADEILQFRRYLQGIISKEKTNIGRDVRRRIKVVAWADTPLRDVAW